MDRAQSLVCVALAPDELGIVLCLLRIQLIFA